MKRFKKMIAITLVGLLSMSCSINQPKEEKKLKGVMGDTLTTMFFEYTVNDAYLIDVIDNMTTKDENQFLVVNITVGNIDEEKVITMGDTDFKIKGKDKTYDPLSTYGFDALLDDEFPGTYTLDPLTSKKGTLLFVVEKGITEFSLEAQEHFKESGKDEILHGDTYAITFSANAK